jgi:hypothetical protein
VLTLRAVNGASFVDAAPIGWPAAAMHKPKSHEGELCIGIGTIQHGQTRDVVVRMRGLPSIPGTPFVQAEVASSCSDRPFITEGAVCAGGDDDGEIAVQLVRCNAVDTIRRAVQIAGSGRLEAARAMVCEFVAKVRSTGRVGGERRVGALLEDLEGQVMQALSRQDWYERWGRHYLPSLAGAHQLQQANNFKDPGVQVYGGPLFAALRDDIDEIFVRLPPPVPSARRPPSPARQPLYAAAPGRMKQGSAGHAPAIDMRMYMDASGGCFAGQCAVLMDDGTQRRADSVRRGDVLAGGAKVLCVVRTACTRGVAQLVALPGGLLITPWHPVDVHGNGAWRFPHDIAPESLGERACEAVFTFVLDRVHHATVCGVRCVTLAHGTVGDVREHPYFGTHRVLEDLMASPGWVSGMVVLEPGQLLRDEATHLVTAILAAPS